MHAIQIAVFVALGLWMLHAQRGQEVTRAARCVRCNVHPGQRHKKDCPWAGKYDC